MGNANESLYDIAIIGMAGRFPGAKNVQQFWQNLRDGVESISFFTDEQLEAAGVDASLLQDSNYVKAAATLDDIDLFDASFFGFYPREAEMMDPQQRIFLEVAWEALEVAGYNPELFEGRIGVYAGVSKNRYLVYHLAANPDLAQSLDTMQTIIGNDRDFLATSISYKLNLKGPSLTVQTACSTSLVAVHLACQSLLNRECDMALAGGVSVRLLQKEGYVYEEGSINSPDGHCRAFDARAQGTVGGDGAGIVVLRRLADAIAAGDNIRAVIKGSAVNNDGAVKIGYTAPSVSGQADVVAEALAMACVDAETISYVETHGTATTLGDPIEITALTQAFQSAASKKASCAIGSVKTNIGHLDAAAGVAGLIKTALALDHKMLPPSLHYEQPNPRIDFSNTPFYVNAALSEWKSNGAARRAGVSSFGIGGTNAHVVLEEAPARELSDKSRSHHLLLLSAKTGSARDAATANLAEHFKNHPRLNIADAAYTLAVGRTSFEHRRMIVANDLSDAVAALEMMSADRVFTHHQERRDRWVVFMFPGQGSQHVRMGFGLYNSEPEFRKRVDECSEILASHIGIDLRGALYAGADSAEQSREQIDQTLIAQPSLFVIEYALAQLWMQWGIRPRAMIGHSVGEYVAACLAGVLSLEDALRLVAARGRLMQNLPTGSMLAVSLSENELGRRLTDELSLAAINSRALCVASGPTEAIEKLERQLAEEGVGCRRLRTSHAFHSEMMEPILKPFEDEVKKVSLNAPQIPFISNVTGTRITADQATSPNYWATHLRRAVRFADGIAELAKESAPIFLEVGPGQALNKLAKSHLNQADARFILASMRQPDAEQQSDVAVLLEAAGRLWLAGAQVDWPAFYGEQQRRRVILPSYSFERQRYWVEPQTNEMLARSRQTGLEKKADIADWFYAPVWKQSPLIAATKSAQESNQKSTWLVFLDERGPGSQLVERLKAEGHDAIAVAAGSEFDKTGDHDYIINPREPNDYESLLKEIRALNKTPQKIVHLWNVTAGAAAQRDDSIDEAEDRAFYSLLFLAQALGGQDFAEQIQIGVVSNDLQDVTGEEELCPMKSLLLGPCLVIPQEYQNIACRSIDVAAFESEARRERVIEQLLEELAADSPDAVVAYRGAHRWTQSIEAVRLKEPSGELPRLRQGGVYLITGGLSNFGLGIAERLARAAKAKLVLMDGSALAAESEQDEETLRRLRAIEEAGAEILTINATTSAAEQVKAAVAQAIERFTEIHGVIHTETVQGQGLIQLKTREMAAAALDPKVKGTLALESALKDVKLDFLILFSSTTSLMGGFGLVDYCAANNFLDAYARSKNSRRDFFASSIDWSQLRWDDWQESLMSNIPEVQAQFKEARESYGITLEEAAETFSRVLSHGLPQVIVSTQDFAVVLEQSRAITASGFLDQLSEMRESDEAYSRPNLATDYAPPSNEIEQAIVDIACDLFGIEGIGIHDNFFDIGGNSLVAITFISRLRKAFNAELSIGNLFEAPTVAGLASIIAQGQLKQEEIDELNQILSEIEGLSLEEVQAQLATEAQPNNEGEFNE